MYYNNKIISTPVLLLIREQKGYTRENSILPSSKTVPSKYNDQQIEKPHTTPLPGSAHSTMAKQTLLSNNNIQYTDRKKLRNVTSAHE